MELNEIIVEVRDRTLTRLGVILAEDMELTVTGVLNNVGTFELAL